MKIWILHRSDLGSGSRIVGMWSSVPSAKQVSDTAGQDISVEVAHTVIDQGTASPFNFVLLELEHKDIPKGQFI